MLRSLVGSEMCIRDRIKYGPIADMAFFDWIERNLDALLARPGLDTARPQAALLELELDGAVARLPGGLFQRQGTA